MNEQTTTTLLDSSSELIKFFEGMSLVQGETQQPKHDEKVDYISKDGRRVKYDYSSLGEVIKVLKEPCAKYGFSVIQYESQDDSKLTLHTIISHKSGQWMKFTTPMFGDVKNDPKLFGTSKTYARRYALYGIFNLFGQQDTDGSEMEPEKKEKSVDGKITPRQLQILKKHMDVLSISDVEGFLNHYKINKTEELSFEDFEKANKQLSIKVANQMKSRNKNENN